MKNELGGKNMKEFIGLREKICNYLKDNNDEDKKAKGTKKSVLKRKLKFEDYENCLEAAQTENKINHLEEWFDVDSPKKFIKNNKLIVKTQQIFNSETQCFYWEINQIAFSSGDEKILPSIDSIEKCAHGTSTV